MRTLQMSSYVVLARKWRPAQFSDLVGQGPVIRTLMNAIRSDRIHHAYVLTGSRGIGKTSIARIFAKAVRCPNAKWVKDGKTEWLQSCDECSSCKEIATGTSVDVIEIDGASNNGVDAVREIRENAKFLPSSGSKKVYIIDEVHMLTTAAFNALLKTLEEPPAHVLFVLATTEAHKIPGTILSRCQRFDLKKYSITQIQDRITQVAKSEKISVDAGALSLLARASEGSMRDALSLLDQVIAYSGDKVTAETVRESIGLIEGQTLLGVLDGIFSRKPEKALQLIDEAYRSGHDLKLVVRNLIELLHAAMILKIGAITDGLEYSNEEIEELKKIAAHRELEEIELFFQVFQNGVDWVSKSPQPRIVLEVLIIKCAMADALVRISATPANPAPTSGGGGSLRSAPAPTPTRASTSFSTPSAQTSPAPSIGSTPPVPTQPIAVLSEAMNSSAAAQPTVLKTGSLLFGNNALKRQEATNPDSSPAGAPFSGTRSWETFIEFVRARRPLLASLLERASCDLFPANPTDEFTLCFSEADAHYYKEQISNRTYQEQLNQITKEYFGSTRKLFITTREKVESVAGKREQVRAKQESDAKIKVMNHPIIAEAKNLFGGEMGPIEWTSDDGDRS